MARHGTLPEFMYQRQCEISERPVAIAFDEQGNTADAAKENELEEDEADEFDQSSDEKRENSRCPTSLRGEIGSSATFLLGARTRFGREIRFNNRLLYCPIHGTNYVDF